MLFNPLEKTEAREAIFKERLARDVAFFGVSEEIAGFAVRQMTLRDYMLLRVSKNPLIRRERPTPEQLAAFLWFMSEEYSLDPRARRDFLSGCRYFQVPGKPLFKTKRAMVKWTLRSAAALAKFNDVAEAALDYVKEQLQDQPPSRKSAGYTPSYYSDATFWCALLAREFGYSIEAVMGMPLKALFGFVSEIKEHHEVKEPQFNPSDLVIAKLQQV